MALEYNYRDIEKKWQQKWKEADLYRAKPDPSKPKFYGLEFFPYPDLDPLTSSFSCCLRLDELDRFYAACKAAGLLEKQTGHPRLHPPAVEPSGMRIAYMVDPDGSLIRLVQNG